MTLRVQVEPILSEEGRLDRFEWRLWDGTTLLHWGKSWSEETAFQRGEEAASTVKWKREFGIKEKEV